MIKFSIIALVFLVMQIGCTKGRRQSTVSNNSNEIVNEYKNLSANRSSQKSKTLLSLEKVSEGSEALLYSFAGIKRLIITRSFGDLGKIEEDYLFQEDLQYWVRRQYDYDKPFYMEGSAIIDSTSVSAVFVGLKPSNCYKNNVECACDELTNEIKRAMEMFSGFREQMSK